MMIIKVHKRIKVGKKFNKKLRIKNIIPSIIYQKYNKSILIKIVYSELFKLIKELKKSNKKFLIILKQKKFYVYIKDIQYHPCTNSIIHIDFIQI